jgi:hypothetical protein
MIVRRESIWEMRIVIFAVTTPPLDCLNTMTQTHHQCVRTIISRWVDSHWIALRSPMQLRRSLWVGVCSGIVIFITHVTYSHRICQHIHETNNKEHKSQPCVCTQCTDIRECVWGGYHDADSFFWRWSLVVATHDKRQEISSDVTMMLMILISLLSSKTTERPKKKKKRKKEKKTPANDWSPNATNTNAYICLNRMPACLLLSCPVDPSRP